MMTSQLLNICFILSSCIMITGSLVFLTHPDNITVVHGSEVEFSCVARDSNSIHYIVNGTTADNQSIIDKGFIQLGTEDIDSTTRRRSLTATALTQYNNTEIQCVAIEFGNPEQPISHIGILLVQGLLSSVGDISHNFIDSSSLNISWNPPFTLPGTHITGYNISVTSIMFNISQFITDTYYVLTAPNNTDPCDEISITVSGYNGAGNGEMTTISSLYFPKVTYDNRSTDITSTSGEVVLDEQIKTASRNVQTTISLTASEALVSPSVILTSGTSTVTTEGTTLEPPEYPPIHVIIPGIIVPFVPFGALVILIILAYKKCKRRNYTCTKERDIHRHPSVESGTVHVHVDIPPNNYSTPVTNSDQGQEQVIPVNVLVTPENVVIVNGNIGKDEDNDDSYSVTPHQDLNESPGVPTIESKKRSQRELPGRDSTRSKYGSETSELPHDGIQTTTF